MNSKMLFEEFEKNGFAVIKNFLGASELENLEEECSNIVENMSLPERCSVFHTQKDQDAVDEEGNLVVQKGEALNKMGHALHWLSPNFKSVTFSNKVKEIFKSLKYENPVVVQSMVIFKHPEIGGIVTPHQDSTFLYTDPPSTIGSHKGKIYQRYVRNPDGEPRLILKGDMPEFNDSSYVPVLAKKGDCVIIHGSAVHKSGKNTSDKSRPVYTFHVVESSGTEYSKENWLQPSEDLPFPSLYHV